MLVRLLRLLADQGSRSTAELAGALGVPAALVRTMLDDLTRRGYLATITAGCSTGCGSCATRTVCAEKDRPGVWSITEKGARLLRETDPA